MVWFFVFKQKTAYEMRISDWSSDVCSSDLLGVLVLRGEAVVDDLLVRGVLLELGRGFAQIRRIPEALPDALGLVHDLLLFEQLGEQDVERDDRHDDENAERSEEHTSELQSLMRISYAVFCLKKKKINITTNYEHMQSIIQ